MRPRQQGGDAELDHQTRGLVVRRARSDQDDGGAHGRTQRHAQLAEGGKSVEIGQRGLEDEEGHGAHPGGDEERLVASLGDGRDEPLAFEQIAVLRGSSGVGLDDEGMAGHQFFSRPSTVMQKELQRIGLTR